MLLKHDFLWQIKSKIIMILLLFFFLKYKYKYYKSKKFSCKNWAKGLNNSEIDNNSKNYPCKIVIPKPNSCYISEFGSYFDFTSLYRPTCSNLNLINNDIKRFLKSVEDLKYISLSNKRHFGYPLTNNGEFNPYEYGAMLYHLKKSFDKDVNKKVILIF